jgi:hypothetical protein
MKFLAFVAGLASVLVLLYAFGYLGRAYAWAAEKVAFVRVRAALLYAQARAFVAKQLARF